MTHHGKYNPAITERLATFSRDDIAEIAESARDLQGNPINTSEHDWSTRTAKVSLNLGRMSLSETTTQPIAKYQPEQYAETMESFSTGAASEASRLHPERNEDSYFAQEATSTDGEQVGRGSAGVFDGAGGHKGSEAASRIASKVYETRLGQLGNEPMERDVARYFLAGTAQEASSAIVEYAREKDLGNIITTGVVLDVRQDPRGSEYAAWVSVGDSRLYTYTSSGLEVQTLDDSLALQASFSGDPAAQLEEQKQRANHDTLLTGSNVITNALGDAYQPESVKTGVIEIDQPIRFLLLSDGVTDNLRDDDIQETLKRAEEEGWTDKETADALVKQAFDVARGSGGRSKADDITAVVITKRS